MTNDSRLAVHSSRAKRNDQKVKDIYLWRNKTTVLCLISYRYKSSAVAELGDRLATIDMGRKVGVLCPAFLGAGQLGSHLTQCRLDRGLPPYQVAS